jgi:hypothetical protein
MNQSLPPVKAQLIKQDRKYLEVIVLFITYHINHLVNREIGKTQFSRTYVLRHIDRSSIRPKKQLMIQSFPCEVGPYGTVFFAVEETFLQAFHNLLLPFQIGFRLVINFIESNSHHTISLIEAYIYPIIHLLPQSTHFGIISFPLHQHFTRLFHQRRFRFRLSFRLFLTQAFTLKLRHQLFHFGFIMLVESYIVITNQMITFLTGSFGSFTIAILQPSQH